MSSNNRARRKQKQKVKQKKRDREKLNDFPILRSLDRQVVLTRRPELEKMSDVLMAFVEPYLPEDESDQSMRKLLQVGMVAWNAALVTGDARARLIDGTLAAVPEYFRGPLQLLLDELILRKQVLFPDITRMMLDFTLMDGQLNVISTVPGYAPQAADGV